MPSRNDTKPREDVAACGSESECGWRQLFAAVERLKQVSSPGPEFATVEQAARRLGIGSKALRAAVQRGDVRVYTLGTPAGGRPRVHVPEVREWALGTAVDPHARARAAGDAAAKERRQGCHNG